VNSKLISVLKQTEEDQTGEQEKDDEGTGIRKEGKETIQKEDNHKDHDNDDVVSLLSTTIEEGDKDSNREREKETVEIV